jgi:hypothetical protein
LVAEDSTPFPRLSFALVLSSTSRDPISSVTLNSYLLCFREVAKSLQEGDSLAIIPTITNLSGKTHEKILVPLLAPVSHESVPLQNGFQPFCTHTTAP